MKRTLIRGMEIIIGLALIIAGLVMLFTPGQGLLFIALGILLISPYHGKKALKLLQIFCWKCAGFLPRHWRKKLRKNIPYNFGERIHRKFERFRKKLHRKK